MADSIDALGLLQNLVVHSLPLTGCVVWQQVDVA